MPFTPEQPYPKNPGDALRSNDFNQAVDELLRLEGAKVNRQGDTIQGPLPLKGLLEIATTHDGMATIGAIQYEQDSTAALFHPTPPDDTPRLRVSMAYQEDSGLHQIGEPPPQGPKYCLEVGHTIESRSALGHIAQELSFASRFSIDQDGNLKCKGNLHCDGAFTAGGSKGGYVVDFFVNRAGDTLEQGDVVVIGQTTEIQYYGVYDDIPIPEVDLAHSAYDTRICGVVASFVTEADLPMVDPPPPSSAAEVERRQGSPGKPVQHRFYDMGAKAGATNRKQVASGQLGRMVTLGAYAHCKVDADIAPIEAGDLLTTSPTPGHAQKVLDRSKAGGAVLGKALVGLAKGKGKIPVIVTL